MVEISVVLSAIIALASSLITGIVTALRFRKKDSAEAFKVNIEAFKTSAEGLNNQLINTIERNNYLLKEQEKVNKMLRACYIKLQELELIHLKETVILKVNKNHIIEQTNKACVDVLGWEQEELVGQNINILIPGYLQHKHEKAFDARVQSNELIIDSVTVRNVSCLNKKGEEIPVTIAVHEIVENNERKFIGEITTKHLVFKD